MAVIIENEEIRIFWQDILREFDDEIPPQASANPLCVRLRGLHRLIGHVELYLPGPTKKVRKACRS